MAKDTYAFATPNGETVEIPVYEPGKLDTPALRTVAPDGSGDIVAVRLVADPPLDADHAIRVGAPDGTVYGIDTSTATTLESFEDGAWPDDWTNETGAYSLTTDALVGDYSLQVDSDNTYPQVSNPNLSTPRDQTYSVRTMLSGSDAEAWLLTNVQDPSAAQQNNYAAQLDHANNKLAVLRRENDSTYGLDSTSVSLSAGTEYILALDAGSDSVRARVFDASGSELGATSYVSDTTHTGGYIGVYTDGAAGGTTYDEFKRHPLGAL